MQNNFSDIYLQFGQALQLPPSPQKKKITSQIINLLRAQASPVSGRMLVLIYQAVDIHIPKASITAVLAILYIVESLFMILQKLKQCN